MVFLFSLEQLEQRVAKTEEKIDFFVKTALPPVEGIFFDGQIYDAYEFICGLDETGELTDIVFAYDEAREMLYQVTPYILENSEADEFSPFAYITQGLLYPGVLKTFEGAELPEGVETAAYNFTAMELTDAEEEEEYDGVRGRKAPRGLFFIRLRRLPAGR